MSKFFGKILSLVLTAALLLSVFSVFSFAASRDDEEAEAGTVQLLVNRTFGEGWDVSNGITVLDDAYNSNPQGAKMALGVLKSFAVGEENKRIVITPGFVEMGTRQAEANKELGRTIAQSCDYAIVVNATNRDAIKSGIDEGGLPQGSYFLADSLNHAHAHLAQILRAGDVVLYENDLPDNFK